MADEKLPLKKEQLLRIGKYLIFAGIGVALLVMAGTFSKEPAESPGSNNVMGSTTVNEESAVPTLGDQITHEEAALENRLAEILARVDGAGQVIVRINLASTTEQEFAINSSTNRRTTEEKDGGAVRTISETTDEGQLVMEHTEKSGTDQPVVIKASKPSVLGVLVVAEGAADLPTKLALSHTVETLLSIPAHRICVEPMEK